MAPRHPAGTLLAGALFAGALLSGCQAGDQCLESVSTSCTPAYPPTFDNVFANTLEPRCGVAGGCHGSDTAAGGVTFETANGSQQQLTGQFDGVAYALAGDPACSVLVQVLESDDPEVVMPPSGKLPAAERCAIIQWVANGAKR